MRQASYALAACLLALALAAPAEASQVRLELGTFGSAEEQAFADVCGLAVDQPSGDVLVIDTGAETLSRFHADGTASEFAALGSNSIDGKGAGDGTPEEGLDFGSCGEVQVAVDNSGSATDGDIYVTQASRGAIFVFGSDGSYLGRLDGFGPAELSKPCGVAVDSAGVLYVGDFGHDTIYKFSPSGSPAQNGDGTEEFFLDKRVCTLAAGAGPSAGSLFFARFAGEVYEIDAANGAFECLGTFSAQPIEGGPHASVAVDPASGHLFAARSSFRGATSEWDASKAAVGSECAELVTTINSGLEFAGTRGVAAHGASGKLYTASRASEVRVWGPLVTVPDVVTGEASEVGTTTATLNGTVNPDGEPVTECFFEYGPTTAYGSVEPCSEPDASEVGAGTSPVAVHAEVSDLEAETSYHFRLVAGSANGAVKGANRSFVTQSPPEIVDHWTAEAGFGEATLKAKINPKSVLTSYRFEWGTDSSYGQSSDWIELAEDSSVHTVSFTLDDLAPGTVYHWRVVAESALGTSEGEDREFTTYRHPVPETGCPNQAFRTGASALLPDCRAHEMVSPPDKGGGDIIARETLELGLEGAYRQAAQGGERVTYTSTTAFGDAASGSVASQYLSSRGPGGWGTQGLNPPQGTTLSDPGFSTEIDLHTPFLAFSADLCTALLKDHNLEPLTGDALEGFVNLYRRDSCGAPGAGGFEALTRGPAPAFAAGQGLGSKSGAFAPDGRHVVFGAAVALDPTELSGPPANEGTNSQLYSYDRASGELRVVSMLPEGVAASADSYLGGGAGDNRTGIYEGASSTDGSVIYWNVSGTLYVRVAGKETLPVSSGPATFWAAAADGAAALFSEGGTLYEFDLATAQGGGEAAIPLASGLGGVAGASENLERVYFTSKEALAEGAEAGKWSLYLLDGETVVLVGVLAEADHSAVSSPKIDAASPLVNASRATPDGRHLAFMSTASLTGYDNADTLTGEAASEVFVYDAAAGDLRCASCNPSGARPEGRRIDSLYGASSVPELWTAAWIPTREWANYSRRSISADGKRVFFNSYDSLVPRDENRVQDVYQWEAPGKGSCDTSDTNYFQRNEGCLSLISTGRSPVESEFLDASADGSDLFFTTASSIEHPRDQGLIDVYDARVGGGFPPPEPPEECEGDSCQSVPEPPPTQTPASAAFRGPGDPVARRDCRAHGRRAARLSLRAKGLRKRARRAAAAQQKRRLARRSNRVARRAKRHSAKAKRCRRAARRRAR